MLVNLGIARLAATGARACNRRIGYLLMMSLMVGMLLPVATPQTAYAQDVEFGYYWRLDFGFESDFDAVITIDVGPWENGEMTEIVNSSTATVHCKPVGDVTLENGDAVFANSGYLHCTMDLARLVWDNHGVQIPAIDSYGSVYVMAEMMSTSTGIAPIFTHRDMRYSIDFPNTQSATLRQSLSNHAGPLEAVYQGTTINSSNVYEMEYICVAYGGPCDARFWTNKSFQGYPTAGKRTSFATAVNSFTIGTDGTNFFTGRMSNLVIDPGNSAH